MAVVIAEGTFGSPHPGLDHSLEDKLGVRGDVDRQGLGADHRGRPAAKKAAERDFVHALGKRRHGGEEEDGIGSEHDGDLQRLSAALRLMMVEATALLDLPVHAGLIRAVDVHAVEAEVALASALSRGDYQWIGDEAAAVPAPALQDGQAAEVRFLHHLLGAREELAAGAHLRRPKQRLAVSQDRAQTRWLHRLEELVNLLANLTWRPAEADLEASLAREDVDRERIG